MRTVPKLSPEEQARLRDEWLQVFEALSRQVRGWAEKRGWTVTEEPREINEERLGIYQAPVLQIETPHGSAFLEPIARDVAGADGRVDLYAWPTHFRVKLLRRPDGIWYVRTDSGINWPHPWRGETFVELVEGLLDESWATS
jgi:hypothetical protein